MPLASIQHVSYAYPDGNIALSDVSFTIEYGEKIALIGNNGSGKSTLLYLLGALLLPSKGTISIDGISLSRTTKSAVRKNVGMLFSQVEYQFIMPDCLNDVMLSIREGTKEERKAQAMQYLRHVNLDADFNHNPLFLSSGQMKRAALASVLAKKPALLLLDEPLASLDKPSSCAVLDILTTHNIAMLFATHSRHAVKSLAQRVIVLDGGCIMYDGSPKSREAKTHFENILL